MTYFFMTFRVTIIFLRDFFCVHRGDFSESSDCDFLQLILFANTAAFFYSREGNKTIICQK